MHHHRRARPTLRLLREDLTSGWESASAQRAIREGRLADLHPLSELQHPIIAKATDCFGESADDDNFVGPIGSSTHLPLKEIRQSQWRGGVWEDQETGVRWLVVAGLAKGGHEDRDDFYQQVGRVDTRGNVDRWLPTHDDVRLLKQETAERIRIQWELETQRAVLEALSLMHAGGSHRLTIQHPVPGVGQLASVDMTVEPVRDENHLADEILVEIKPDPKFAASNLVWQMTIRILISLEPPEQGWDRVGDTYTNIGTPGAWTDRQATLSQIVQSGDLAVSEPGSMSHYAHREHLAGTTINGEAVRALCGPFFVPRQDHESLPVCPTCAEKFAALG